MWSNKFLKVQLDISTYCNARCPQCHRNDDNTLEKVDWLPKVNWTLDDFKKVFPPDVLQSIGVISFCPTWGDPCMNPDLMDMIKYAVESNRHINITIDTNGSMQTEEWWWFLSGITKTLGVTFAIDGTTQEMHGRYRRGTDLQKVLNNMQTFSEGLGTAQASTIMFKHNEDHLDDIRALAFKYGAKKHTTIPSTRFGWYSGMEGRENTSTVGHFYDKYDDEEFMLEIRTKKLEGAQIAQIGGLEEDVFDDDNIKCTWMASNTVSMSFNGQVLPCCYTVNGYVKGMYSEHTMDVDRTAPAMKYYMENEDQYNAFNHSLLDIIQKPFFELILEESFDSNHPIRQCVKHCSKRGEKTQPGRLIASSRD